MEENKDITTQEQEISAVEPKEETNADILNNLEIKANPAKDFLYFIWDLFKTGVIVFILAFALRYFVVQPFIVDGESMMPNYINNEYLLAEKLTYHFSEPKRGDVIVFRYPGNPSVSYIKRVIGLPGEKIAIKDNNVTIFNTENPQGIKLKEGAYLPTGTLTLLSENGGLEKNLGKDEFFVMGDNRPHSSDSRDWGILPRANIIGRSWLTLLPTNKFGFAKRVNYPDLSFGQSLLALLK